MQWAMEDSLFRIQEALRGLFRNLPFRPLGWLMRFLIFPTGLRFHRPTDRMDKAAAKLLLQPSTIRDSLTEGIYTSEDIEEKVGLLDRAMEAAYATVPIDKLLREAKHAGKIFGKNEQDLIEQALSKGVITPDQASKMREAEELRDKVIQVDAFKDLNPCSSQTKPKAKARAKAKPKAKSRKATE